MFAFSTSPHQFESDFRFCVSPVDGDSAKTLFRQSFLLHLVGLYGGRCAFAAERCGAVWQRVIFSSAGSTSINLASECVKLAVNET